MKRRKYGLKNTFPIKRADGTNEIMTIEEWIGKDPRRLLECVHSSWLKLSPKHYELAEDSLKEKDPEAYKEFLKGREHRKAKAILKEKQKRIEKRFKEGKLKPLKKKE